MELKLTNLLSYGYGIFLILFFLMHLLPHSDNNSQLNWRSFTLFSIKYMLFEPPLFSSPYLSFTTFFLIGDWWKTLVFNGWPDHFFMLKSKALKEKLSVGTDRYFPNVFVEMKELKDKLVSLDSLEEVGKLDERSINQDST